jgi:hypothetical protein
MWMREFCGQATAKQDFSHNGLRSLLQQEMLGRIPLGTEYSCKL